MRRFATIFVILLGLQMAAFAGGRGGYSTTFDPNSYGGGWACFRSAASGTCGGATAQFFNAACDGVTDDSAALAAWITYGHGLGAAQAKLYVPAGSRCNFPGASNASFCADHTVSDVDNGIQNCLIWAYGASVNRGWIGGRGYYSDNTHNALIQAANAGDTSITLVTAGDALIFPPGRRIAVTGLGIQTFGQPVDHMNFEYKIATAITGTTTKTIILDSALKNSYKTTWPQLDTGSGGQPNQGGPAMVYLMEPTWNTNATVFGLTIDGPQSNNVVGRNVVTYDVKFTGTGGINPSGSQNLWFFGASGQAVEIDKNISFLAFVRGVISGSVTGQSMNDTLLLDGLTVRGSLNGNSVNTTIRNSSFATGIKAGPIGAGHGNSLALDGVTYPTALGNYHFALISSFSFAGGVLTISKASGTYDASVRVFVPGYKYFMGDTDGSNTCSSANTFTVNDIVDAGANVNIVTDISAIPITIICGGTRAPSTFGAYQAMSLTQKFSGPGNLLSNPEMLPP